MAESLQAAAAIDARTPHRDRKLQAAVVFWPRPFRPRDAAFRIAARGDSLEFVTAEPAFDYLRSVERAEKSPE
jgi:hypothetical protein